ncbi:MAG: CBS domain-containing protein [Zoogloeaceae bacterium]|nr:CBS domain-containing protein [Zoogloeaceae bacterium]
MITISVKQVLDQKGHATFSVTPTTTVFDALALMAEHDIGAVLVMENDQLRGIFTERDYARKLVLKGVASRTAPVCDMMTSNVQTVAPSDQLGSIMSTMTKKRFRHLPVVDEGKVVGMITIGDVVKVVMEQQEATIQQLSSYIAGDLAT